LPTGIAWPRESDTILQKVVYGFAGIMGWCDGRAGDLLERESDPRITVEMLDSWERAWGLPDPCYKPGTPHLNPDGSVSTVPEQTIGERQRALVMRMTLLGAQSREFFEGVAEFLGYHGTHITEYRPYMAGLDRCGYGDKSNFDTNDPAHVRIGSPARMRFAWTMHIPKTKLVWARASKTQCGIDPMLRIVFAVDLECVIRRWRPAHTEVIFDYSGNVPYGNPYAGSATPLEAFCTLSPGDVVCSDNDQPYK